MKVEDKNIHVTRAEVGKSVYLLLTLN